MTVSGVPRTRTSRSRPQGIPEDVTSRCMSGPSLAPWVAWRGTAWQNLAERPPGHRYTGHVPHRRPAEAKRRLTDVDARPVLRVADGLAQHLTRHGGRVTFA